MAFRTRYRRKAPSTPEMQGLFFNKAQVTPTFFNPSRQMGDRSPTPTTDSVATPVVQRQEGTPTPAKLEEEKPMQKMDKQEEEKPVQKMDKREEEKPIQKQTTREEEKPVQKQAKQEEEKPIQKQAKEEEKPIQKLEKQEEMPVQKQDKLEEEKPVQKLEDQNPQQPAKAKGSTYHLSPPSSEEPQEPVGLPDRLKDRIEALSGIPMDDVKVHYNSPKPARLQALAFTQGTDIYLAPGQEKHLPHEAWHVVQQKQGRAAPTLQTKGVNVNDDPGLEQEATVMGQTANRQPSLDYAQ